MNSEEEKVEKNDYEMLLTLQKIWWICTLKWISGLVDQRSVCSSREKEEEKETTMKQGN
jgi:hypothetical protein